MKKHFRLYLDTSVFGGYFEPEFAEHSKKLIRGLVKGQSTLIISEILQTEIDKAPEQVRELLYSIPQKYTEFIPIDDGVAALYQQYLAKKVVPAKSLNDAAHVALATVSRADAIISWNFKHIVRLDRIKGFNQVNFEMGYRDIFILSPREVEFYD